MFALILDSLGGTELIFILVIALIFFGPRKLPQLARTMGKGLAEFRKASDDFKRTWEREVELEGARAGDGSMFGQDSSLEAGEAPPIESGESTEADSSSSETDAPSYKPADAELPSYKPADSELVVARESPHSTSTTESESSTVENATPIEPTRKQDWL